MFFPTQGSRRKSLLTPCWQRIFIIAYIWHDAERAVLLKKFTDSFNTFWDTVLLPDVRSGGGSRTATADDNSGNHQKMKKGGIGGLI